ncbi:MAG: VirB8/TrbF family protein [Neisseriaceae bacterium]
MENRSENEFLKKKIENLNLEVEQLKEKGEKTKLNYLTWFVALLFLIFAIVATNYYLMKRNSSTPQTIIIDDDTFLGKQQPYYLESELEPQVKEKEIKALLIKYVEAFYDKSTNEPESQKRISLMSEKSVLETYKQLYEDYLQGTKKETRDKFWPTVRVLDINLLDEETAQLRIQSIMLLKHPTKEYDRFITDATHVVEVKFKLAKLRRTAEERLYDPIDLLVTEFRELE